MNPSIEVFSKNFTVDSFIKFTESNNGKVVNTLHNDAYCIFYSTDMTNTISCNNIVESISESKSICFDLEKNSPQSHKLMNELLFELNKAFLIRAELTIYIISDIFNIEFVENRFSNNNTSIEIFSIYNVNISDLNSALIEQNIKYELNKIENLNLDNTLKMSGKQDIYNGFDISIYNEGFDFSKLKQIFEKLSKKNSLYLGIGNLFSFYENDFELLIQQKNVAFY
jgi:hypothetical protein